MQMILVTQCKFTTSGDYTVTKCTLVLCGLLCLVLVESFSFMHTHLDMLFHRFIKRAM